MSKEKTILKAHLISTNGRLTNEYESSYVLLFSYPSIKWSVCNNSIYFTFYFVLDSILNICNTMNAFIVL